MKSKMQKLIAPKDEPRVGAAWLARQASLVLMCVLMGCKMNLVLMSLQDEYGLNSFGLAWNHFHKLEK